MSEDEEVARGCGDDATEEEKLAVEAMPENYGQDEFDAEWAELADAEVEE